MYNRVWTIHLVAPFLLAGPGAGGSHLSSSHACAHELTATGGPAHCDREEPMRNPIPALRLGLEERGLGRVEVAAMPGALLPLASPPGTLSPGSRQEVIAHCCWLLQ